MDLKLQGSCSQASGNLEPTVPENPPNLPVMLPDDGPVGSRHLALLVRLASPDAMAIAAGRERFRELPGSAAEFHSL